MQININMRILLLFISGYKTPHMQFFHSGGTLLNISKVKFYDVCREQFHDCK